MSNVDETERKHIHKVFTTKVSMENVDEQVERILAEFEKARERKRVRISQGIPQETSTDDSTIEAEKDRYSKRIVHF